MRSGAKNRSGIKQYMIYIFQHHTARGKGGGDGLKNRKYHDTTTLRVFLSIVLLYDSFITKWGRADL